PESRDTLTPNLIMNSYTIVFEIHHTSSNRMTRLFQLLKVVQKQQLKGIDNDIYSTVDACPNVCEMWKAIERNQCDVTNHQVNVQFILQLQPEWKRFVTLVKQSQELKTVSYHKLYDILKQDQNEVNEIRAERLAHDEISKDKEIDKLMALISLSFKKIYKPTNNNLQTSSNTNRANQDNSSRINRGTGYDNQRIGNVTGAKENVGTPVVQQSGIQCYNCKEYRHVAREYAADNSGPIFDSEPMQKVSTNENYNVFAIESEHHEQSKSVNDTYSIEQDEHNVIINSLDMSYDREQVDQDDDDDDLANERDLHSSLIEKLKCEVDDRENHNKFLKTSNKALVDKLQGEVEDFKTKNKSLESSNNHFKEANNELSKTTQLMYKDLKKFQAELNRYHNVKYASKVEIDCAKAKGDLMSYKMEFEKASNEYTRKINNLNQTISEIKRSCLHIKKPSPSCHNKKRLRLSFIKHMKTKKLIKSLL
nr:hypothetical protein [Tanacetum cinerariifolium]